MARQGRPPVSAYRGVRIADFSQGVAGPMAAMLLGDFEAEVVKVEPPGGDRLADHPGYLAFNRNKQVVTLDLETPEGLAAARELVAGADVAIFDCPPGELERPGLHGASESSGGARALNQPPLPRGVPPGANPRYRLYQCADGEWFFLGTLFTNFYRKAFEVLGLEDAFEALEIDMVAARDLLTE